MDNSQLKHITSSNNALIKNLKMLLTSSSARSKNGQTVLEGVTICDLYLEKYGSPEMCLVSDDVKSSQILEILTRLNQLNAKIITVPRTLYNSFSNLDNGEGICFVIKIPEAGELVKNQSALLIDRLQDPGNMGTIMRAALASGVENIYCSRGTVSLWSPKVLRSAMGAHFSLNLFESADLPEVIKGTSAKVLATSSHAKETIYQTDLSKEVMWVVGNEGQGVSDDLAQLCDDVVSIPHQGDIESLNAAIATAVCLFEQMRQRIS